MMTERPESRARNLALAGLVFECLLTAFLVLMTLWTKSEALRALTFLSGCGILIWLYLALIYHQRVLVQEEALEIEQLRREREAGIAAGAIFDLDKEELLLAQRRLQWMYRWLLPIFTILIVLALLVCGLWMWSWRLGESIRASNWQQIELTNATLAIWFVGGAAFLSFLMSRYASGMARYPEWRMLRSGASWLMGITLGAVAVSGTLAPLHYAEMYAPERVLAYVLRILLLVLATEVLFNFILDFYRPRKPGDEPRPAFDSRLLGLFSEPGGIARSIADAVNYQFGFEVSSSWLYKLLERAALPLAGFAVIVLFAASALVIVQADQQAVIERFGVPHRVVDPGLHLKLPWPIDIAYKVQTQQIHEFRLGDAAPRDPKKKEEPLLLWTNDHEDEPHVKVLISTPELEDYIRTVAATRPASEGDKIMGGPTFSESGAAVGVSILRVAMTIQYQIHDAKEWISTYKDPEAMLRAIAGHELTHYCASQTVERMLGPERSVIEKELWKRIAARADQAKLGIDIKFLGLQGVHPPKETAEAFQDVIGAEQKRVASIESAKADYNKRLSEIAGNVATAEALDAAIRRLGELSNDPSATEADHRAAREEIRTLIFGDADKKIPPIGGLASGIISRGRAERWALENSAKAEAIRFQALMASKAVAPKTFMVREKLSALAKGLAGIRKYVVATKNKVDIQTFHLNLQDPVNAPLNFAAGSE